MLQEGRGFLETLCLWVGAVTICTTVTIWTIEFFDLIRRLFGWREPGSPKVKKYPNI